MTKLVEINTVCNGSTGKIMKEIAKDHIENGGEAICFYGRRKGYDDIPCEKFGGFFSFWLHVFITTVFDRHGHGSYFKTKKLIKRIKEENPDIIHLHNIHGYYLNLPLLFNYLKNEYKGELKWTFHDCWPFTGHCAYFTYAKCDKWKTCCHNCPNKKRYPVSLFLDNSKGNYLEKKELFTGLKNLTIITPSDWLNNLVKQSFLKDYDVVTINNKIDLNIFKPIEDLSVINKYNIPKDKKVLLGVASIWEERKGLNDFIKIADKINNEYIIVLVGLNKSQIKLCKKHGIIGIERTNNQQELAALYSYATFFINPTYEDNYPTVNLEAIACGTKVICYNTGGCSEQINKNNGYLIKVGDIDEVINIIKKG